VPGDASLCYTLDADRVDRGFRSKRALRLVKIRADWFRRSNAVVPAMSCANTPTTLIIAASNVDSRIAEIGNVQSWSRDNNLALNLKVEIVFGRTCVKRFVLCYRTVDLSVLSVCL